MKILSIDTTDKLTYLTLQVDEKLHTFISQKFVPHSKTLLTSIQELLKEANLSVGELDALAVVVGPGSFTGCRLGISVVKGLAYPHNTKVIQISTLELLSFMANVKKDDVSLLSGVGNEVFAYQNGHYQLTTIDILKNANNNNTYFAKSSDNIEIENIVKIDYNLNLLAQISKNKFENQDFVSILELKPLYLRDCQAEIDFKRKLNGN